MWRNTYQNRLGAPVVAVVVGNLAVGNLARAGWWVLHPLAPLDEFFCIGVPLVIVVHSRRVAADHGAVDFVLVGDGTFPIIFGNSHFEVAVQSGNESGRMFVASSPSCKERNGHISNVSVC